MLASPACDTESTSERMAHPAEKQPGFVPCTHCGEHEGKVGCRSCRYLVCGACALAGCPRAIDELTPTRGFDGLAIDSAARTLSCDGDTARFEDVIEVIVETQRYSGWTDLHYEYRVRIVLGDRRSDFFPIRIRSLNPLADLNQLVVARGDTIARALGVKLRVDRS